MTDAAASAGNAAWRPSELELGRRAFRRRQTRRSIAISAVSTIVLAVALGSAVLGSPGWARVQQSFFDPEVALASLPRVLEGLWLNIQVLVAASIGVLLFALLLATLRTLRGPVFFPLRALSAAYTDLFRGIPLIIMLYLVGYGIPGLGFFERMPAAFWGTIAIILTYSAYVAEVFRAGIESVHESQRSGARSLGLSTWQTNRHVVLPQAVRRVIPPLMNDFISLQKDVALVSVLGPIEALRRANVLKDRLFNFTPYVVAAILFLCVSVPLTRMADYLLAKERRAMSATAVR